MERIGYYKLGRDSLSWGHLDQCAWPALAPAPASCACLFSYLYRNPAFLLWYVPCFQNYFATRQVCPALPYPTLLHAALPCRYVMPFLACPILPCFAVP